MIKAVLFDCDGVLMTGTFYEILRTRHGISWEMQQPFWERYSSDAMCGRIDLKEVLPEYLARWNFQGTAEDFMHLWISSEANLNEPVLALVADLKRQGASVGLATNQEPHRARVLRAVLNIDEFFDHAFISCEIGVQKPSLEYFRFATRAMGCKAEEILFFDDKPENIQAARASGWQAAQFKAPEDSIEVLKKILDGYGYTATLRPVNRSNREAPLSP